jgi:hypothetical protein
MPDPHPNSQIPAHHSPFEQSLTLFPIGSIVAGAAERFSDRG